MKSRMKIEKRMKMKIALKMQIQRRNEKTIKVKKI
jgi:hypothetical protein